MHWIQGYKDIFLKITDIKVTSGPLSPLGWGLAMTNGQGRQLGGEWCVLSNLKKFLMVVIVVRINSH